MSKSFYMSGVDLSDMKNRLGIAVYSLEAWYFSDETAENTLKKNILRCRVLRAWII